MSDIVHNDSDTSCPACGRNSVLIKPHNDGKKSEKSCDQLNDEMLQLDLSNSRQSVLSSVSDIATSLHICDSKCMMVNGHAPYLPHLRNMQNSVVPNLCVNGQYVNCSCCSQQRKPIFANHFSTERRNDGTMPGQKLRQSSDACSWTGVSPCSLSMMPTVCHTMPRSMSCHRHSYKSRCNLCRRCCGGCSSQGVDDFLLVGMVPLKCDISISRAAQFSHVIISEQSRCSTTGDNELDAALCDDSDDKHLTVDLKPNVFKKRVATTKKWFAECNHEQKNILLKHLLSLCHPPQLHLLSMCMEANLHRCCPPNCQDFLTWLPSSLSSKIMAYLDPVSVCRAAQVCTLWRKLADDAQLWQMFCCHDTWRLSKAAEHKQLIKLKSPEGNILWKRVFAERFRLRSNWLAGRCTVRTFEGHSQGILCVQFDDNRIVSGSSDKSIKVWNIRTNAKWSVQTLVGHSGTVRCLHLEGNRLVSGSSDCTIKVWDVSTQNNWSSIACKVTMVGHLDTVRCLQVDSEKVISGSYDMTLKVWDMHTGHCRQTLLGHQAPVLCVHYDDTKIVSGSADKTIKVWNYIGQCMCTLFGHQGAVTCLQFDSRRIVSGSLDCNIKFWDMVTGECINTIDWKAAEGHTGVVRFLQADGWRVVSAADDKTLKVWLLETGQRLVTLRNHSDGVTCLQFNDFFIVSGSYDRTVKLWDFSCC